MPHLQRSESPSLLGQAQGGIRHVPPPHSPPTPTGARQGCGYFPFVWCKPGTGGSETVNKALFLALLMHFLIKWHQINSIKSRGKDPGLLSPQGASSWPQSQMPSCLLISPSSPYTPGQLQPWSPSHASSILHVHPVWFSCEDLARQFQVCWSLAANESEPE